MQEIFKDIPNYEGHYQVSNLSNIKSLKYRKEKILKSNADKDGYLRISLLKDNKRKTFRIHQLVAIAFLNHKLNGNTIVVDHKDYNKLNNNLNNLQLVTQRKNTSKDQFRHNRSSKYIGVCWSKEKNKWYTQIQINLKKVHLGYFKDEYKAHLSYQSKLNEIENI